MTSYSQQFFKLLDPYAVGRIPPVQLVIDAWFIRQYTKKESRIDIDDQMVDRLVAAMRSQTNEWVMETQLQQKRAS